MAFNHDAGMEIPRISKGPIMLVMMLQLSMVDARFIPNLNPVVIRPPPPPPPLVCPPGEVVFNVQAKVCNKKSCRIIPQQRCAVPRPLPSNQFPSKQPAPQPGQPQYVQQGIANLQPGQSSFTMVKPRNLPTQPSTGKPPSVTIIPAYSSHPQCVTVYEKVCMESRSPKCQVTPRQECADSKVEIESLDDTHGDEIELVERYMPSLNTATPQTTTASTSNTPQATTSSSSAPQAITSTSYATQTTTSTNFAPQATTSNSADAQSTTTTSSTYFAPQTTTPTSADAPSTSTYKTTTKAPTSTQVPYDENSSTTSQPPKSSSLKDLLSGSYEARGKNDDLANTNDDSSLPDCPKKMPKSNCKDSKANICRKIDQPVCGVQRFETCSVTAVNHTTQICNIVVDKICQIQSASKSSNYPSSIGNSNQPSQSIQMESKMRNSKTDYSSNLDTFETSLSGDDTDFDDLIMGQNSPSRSKREAQGTRLMTSCTPKTVSVCSIQHVAVIKPSLRMACITVPDLRCVDISNGPFADRIESCSLYQREVCDQFPVFEPVPEPKTVCKNVTVSECYDEIYDASGRNLISRTLKVTETKITCKEAEAQVCGQQRSVDLVVDECSEIEKTSCQSGYTEKCAMVTKRTCKPTGGEKPFSCLLA